MRIGIVCHPTIGGSGVLATELGAHPGDGTGDGGGLGGNPDDNTGDGGGRGGNPDDNPGDGGGPNGTPIPEPSTLSLFGFAAAGLTLVARRRRSLR